MTVRTRIWPLLKFTSWRVPALLLVLGLLAFMMNGLGIWALGDLDHWAQWVRDHRVLFALWRAFLYSATAAAWLSMRRKVRATEPDAAARLLRVEIATLGAVAMIEVAGMFQA